MVFSPRHFAAAAAIIAAGVSIAPATAQTTTITGNAGSTGPNIDYVGQSFSFSGSDFYNNIQFSYLNGTTATASGNLYLYTAAQTVSPTGLANDTTARVGVASASGGSFIFNPTLALSPNTTYYAYPDQMQTHTYSTNNYLDGDLYYTSSDTVNYSVRGFDNAFRVTGTATPEPAAWWLMILGFGATGGALRRQKRRASALTHEAAAI